MCPILQSTKLTDNDLRHENILQFHHLILHVINERRRKCVRLPSHLYHRLHPHLQGNLPSLANTQRNRANINNVSKWAQICRDRSDIFEHLCKIVSYITFILVSIIINVSTILVCLQTSKLKIHTVWASVSFDCEWYVCPSAHIQHKKQWENVRILAGRW